MKTLKPRIATIDTRRGSPVAVDRIRGWQLHKIRQRIMKRDDYTCQMCGRVTVDGEVDHVVPLAVGGGNNMENLQYLCKPCHKLKSDKEEKERG
jgi:5-methylcytosine-specific restriction protein A